MRAKAAEGLLAPPSSDHYEVGIVVQGRAAHNAGRRASFKAHFQIGTGIPLQDTNTLARPSQEIPPELCVTSISRNSLQARLPREQAEAWHHTRLRDLKHSGSNRRFRARGQ